MRSPRLRSDPVLAHSGVTPAAIIGRKKLDYVSAADHFYGCLADTCQNSRAMLKEKKAFNLKVLSEQLPSAINCYGSLLLTTSALHSQLIKVDSDFLVGSRKTMRKKKPQNLGR